MLEEQWRGIPKFFPGMIRVDLKGLGMINTRSSSAMFSHVQPHSATFSHSYPPSAFVGQVLLAKVTKEGRRVSRTSGGNNLTS